MVHKYLAARVAVPAMPDERPKKKVPAFFYRSGTGKEPVKEFLLGLTEVERKLVNADIRSTEYGWPIGMPTCRPLKGGLHEVRTNLPTRIARVLFKIDDDERMVLLHGFVKKTEKTPHDDIERAEKRWAHHARAQKGT